MKVYIKSAVNISDIQAKIAKKQAEIDKKVAWIAKKEASIEKKLNLLSGKLSDEDYAKLETFINELKVTARRKIPDDIPVNTWGLVRSYGYDYESPEGKALYNITDDAESIYNSGLAINEAQGILDKYKNQLSAMQEKADEIDRIPECLKEFMNSIIEKWDEYDLKLKYKSKPFYDKLNADADTILYEGNPYHRYDLKKERLAELYPNIEETDRWRSSRERQFEIDHIINPFEAMYGSLNYARSFWYMTDEDIHKQNQKAGENLILDLLKRVTKITGPVTSWAGLRVTRGNIGPVINGIVTGEDGKAEVESIYAGGYSVQRLHIRTLVKPIK